jgi:hypothetical protein
MATKARPMTELYQRYQAGEVSWEDLRRQVERTTEDYNRARAGTQNAD